MNAHWLFWPVLLPLFCGGLLLAWWQWRDSGTWPRPTLAGWLALLLGGTLLAFATAGEAELLRIWLGGERGLPRALPAVWAVYGLPCWGVALTLWPAARVRRVPRLAALAQTLLVACGWALLMLAGLLQLLVRWTQPGRSLSWRPPAPAAGRAVPRGSCCANRPGRAGPGAPCRHWKAHARNGPHRHRCRHG